MGSNFPDIPTNLFYMLRVKGQIPFLLPPCHTHPCRITKVVRCMNVSLTSLHLLTQHIVP